MLTGNLFDLHYVDPYYEEPEWRPVAPGTIAESEWNVACGTRLEQTLAPHMRRLLTVAYEVGPRKGELLNLEWAGVDLRRKEFTLRRTKNGETRVVPMTPAVYDVFVELRQERRLDTH